ncbi:hypothetical protein JCM19274_2313 [Algibacter lectus]|uniref:Uncharacterized protein n=1 Tax=Algibacter lectus TaxID=221126 RepID=A0A090X0E2_9FLAO|nr:hypothetical protein JCM19274_2313 [Algibacter lectus]
MGILNIKTKKGATNGTFAQINARGGFPSIDLTILKFLQNVTALMLL